MSDCPSRFTLVQARTGDLSPEQLAEVQRHTGDCPLCAALMEELEDNIATFERHEAEHENRLRTALARETAAAEEALRPMPWWSRRRLVAVLVPAAAAVVAVILFSRDLGNPGQPDPEVRFKGTLGVKVVARRGQDQFLVEPGQRLQAGDALRFVITTATPGHLSVFSVDASSTVSSFYPARSPDDDPEPLALARAGTHTLPGSIILDDALGIEHLVVVFSRRSFDRGRVHARARDLLKSGRAGGITARALGIRGAVFSLKVVKIPGAK